MIDRRGFLFGAAVLLAAGCASAEPHRVRLGAGERGGIYHESAELLARAAAQEDRLRIEVVETSGSYRNLELLDAGRVDLALSQIDAVEAASGGFCAIGRMYEDYLQLVVRPDSGIGTVAHLRGSRISLGADGSGTAVTGDRMLRAAGLDPVADLAVVHLSLADAVAALDAGRIDALLWSGGVPTPALTTTSIRLVDIADLVDRLRADYSPSYDRVRIPSDAYPGIVTIETVGVANLIVVSAGLPDRSAAALAELLLYHSRDLVPNRAAGTQFLDGRALIETGRIPLHPGAAQAYRRWHG